MKISTNEPKEVVLGLGKALNDENFQIARRYVSDDMKYVGPFGSRDGAEAYLQEIERLRLKFDIPVSGITLFACGWFQVNAGRVSSLRVTFDPRPLLALSEPIR
jgi:hypothetical protein